MVRGVDLGQAGGASRAVEALDGDQAPDLRLDGRHPDEGVELGEDQLE
jgi:hypothetical protein